MSPTIPQPRSRLSRLPTILLSLNLALAGVAASAIIRAAELPDFVSLVENNGPSIVAISATRRVSTRSIIADEQLEELFRRNPGEDPDLWLERIPEPRLIPAVGSGFVISDDGYVITNNHVVQEADEIQVTLNDRRVFTAEVIGLDQPSDLALLKIDADNLPHVEFGDSDQLRVGAWVLAIGSPFGLEFSAAAGIVSAKGRSAPQRLPVNGTTAYNYMSFIQTDVAINRGNSGGPLFNLDGEVVGINSQIATSGGGSDGVSFAIPSNVAVDVISQLRDSGMVRRGLLGVRMREVDYALAEIFGMDRPRGAFVDEVQPGSPAAIGGILNEDIILQFNDHDIEYYTDLPFYVGQYRPDTAADVVLYRDGNLLTREVILGSSPTNTIASTNSGVTSPRTNPLGFRVAPLGAEARRQLGQGVEIDGVRIAELNAGPGQAAGLREGDIIIALNRQQVTSPQRFAQIANALPDTGFIPIRIVREGQATTLALELTP